MYLKILPAVFVLLFTGCGENSNTPGAGDIVSVRVEANRRGLARGCVDPDGVLCDTAGAAQCHSLLYGGRP